MRPLLLPVLCLLCWPLTVWAADPLAEGRRLFREGQYAAARPLLEEALVGPTRGEALGLLGELAWTTGDLVAAAQRAAQAEEVPGLEAPALLLRGRVAQAQGQYAAARGAYQEALALDTGNTRAKVLLGELHQYLGLKAEARRLLEPLLARDRLGGIASASELVLLGRAALALGKIRIGFDALDQATVVDPSSQEAQLHLGRAALSKEDWVHAQEGFEATARLNPHHPDALVGLARVRFATAATYDELEELRGRALQIAPGHADALRLGAEVALADQRAGEARRLLAPVLARNPADLDALALLGAAAALEDDDRQLQAALGRVRALHPRPAAFWTALGRSAERANRYPDAVTFARRALQADPEHLPALQVLGVNLTRTGREAEARRVLEQSHLRDGYSPQVVNLLNLFERGLGDYRTVPLAGGLTLRGQREELVLLDLFVAPLLEQLVVRYGRSYSLKLAGPVAVEVFHDPRWFAVRSVGLPAISGHGVSFGRLVTARSPSSNDFNWAYVFTHELAHVYGMQLSRYRVPRWLTEGLAELEAQTGRPEWRRRHQRALSGVLQEGRLPGILEQNAGFTHARRLGEAALAYQLAGLVVELLAESWGHAGVIALHRGLARGRPVAELLTELTGLTIRQLDERLQRWLTGRLAPLRDLWRAPTAGDLVEPPGQTPSTLPADPTALAALAAQLLLREPPAPPPDPAAALELAQRALASRPELPLALYVAGVASARLGRPAEATISLLRLTAGGVRSVEVALLLAQLLLTGGDPAGARAQLEEAARLDPEEPETFRLLALVARSQGDELRSREALRQLALLDPHDPVPSLLVASELLAAGNPAEAEAFVRRGIEAGLFSPVAHELAARVALAQHRPELALRHGFAASYLARLQPGRAWGRLATPPLAGAGEPAASLSTTAAALAATGKLAPAARALRVRLQRHRGAEGLAELLGELATVEGRGGGRAGARRAP
ncbi:MAG: tetratricopeptide repeat protein [Myxococcota bacterium]|nr:tetratricopeptide repeat protein [Myxococcota bacterium]